ncbi:SigE family RNA polymerase sigma factor [Kitasatospora aureofaciens]|uniref:RNA polymerase sigma24 factor n=1 Tax=Kitasatospora aureofaciens TaxID=1894 RepID=A0A1E7MWP7_KITAU|nr:SigE family RNA polymerase sigma factor [Kitasatospora aureofaciens]QEV01370.1 SigE family RNA polymerase sigma factor [Streptomyces viridifaciens]ARF80129.1 SigE family RNA polymerase sigma factor [Kitasatospora aureofaciens]OEV32866.1 RNA polymerase subunit sigma-24 [Kitasatospora aureofaciens]UKZ07753.1 SigE family RNA polymerase sigma factor [Streptomyces viridifaciens]GGV06384.1 RNA polymerase sigma24 factor [Kitasatospora aureofaciens]
MAKQTRDEEFTVYVASRSGWLRKVAYLLCGDWHRADDLVQETITKLYVNWARASRMENRDGYARRVLVNTFLAEQRSPWWRRTLRSEAGPEGVAGDVDLDASLDLRRALAALPPRQRATVVLRYYCDLSIEQAAETLGCSSGNVKSQSSRALEALRGTLAPRPTAAERTP